MNKKDLYKKIKSLNTYYYKVFINSARVDKEFLFKIPYIKINNLLLLCSDMYFSDVNKNFYESMLKEIRYITFLIRNIRECDKLTKKQNKVISKLLADTQILLKEEIKNNDIMQ